MSLVNPPNADDVRALVDERLKAVEDTKGFQETVSVEWRGQPRSLPVIAMPVDLLSYNPDTHRVRAQRSLDPERNQQIEADPFGSPAQAYLHQLLAGDPSDPSKRDPSFDALKEDLKEHGQNEPGIITRSGVLINGNTRRAALKELGQEHIRVGVLPGDAGFADVQSIELSLQLRKDYKREYSFMNFLLAIDERVDLGRPAAEIQRDFRIKATTFERSRWILGFVRDAIERSQVADATGAVVGLRLIDFEAHQGKLEELYRSYTSLKGRAPDEAEALREQRLLAIALGKSKTDVRLIEADFIERYMKDLLPATTEPAPAVKIPGTSIVAPGASAKVSALRDLTTTVLKARAVELGASTASPEDVSKAADSLRSIDTALDTALTQAGKTGRITKKRYAAADRLSDATEDIELALHAVSEARATGNFEVEDLDEVLSSLRVALTKLAQLATRGSEDESDPAADGVAWLKSVVSLS